MTDLSGEPDSTYERYGPDCRKPGTFAYNCLLARRLAERGVRFIHLYHRGWDHHDEVLNNQMAMLSVVSKALKEFYDGLVELGVVKGQGFCGNPC